MPRLDRERYVIESLVRGTRICERDVAKGSIVQVIFESDRILDLPKFNFNSCIFLFFNIRRKIHNSIRHLIRNIGQAIKVSNNSYLIGRILDGVYEIFRF